MTRDSRLAAPTLAGDDLLDELQVRARAFSDRESVRTCGLAVVPQGLPSVSVHESGRVRHVGVMRCGSPWECPSCSRALRGARSYALSAMGEDWVSRGGRLALMTLTVRHHSGHSLEELLAAVSRGWAAVSRLRPWRDSVSRWGGFARALEVTRGANGWHPHLHVLMFLPENWSRCESAVLRDEVSRIWRLSFQSDGSILPTDAVGVDVSDIEGGAAGYIVKSGLGLDRARGAGLEIAGAGKGSLWRMLLDGEVMAWKEYGAAMRGRRSVSLSRGLMERYGDLWRSEQEILEEGTEDGVPLGDSDPVVRSVVVPVPLWRELASRPWVLRLFDEACRGGAADVGGLLGELEASGVLSAEVASLRCVVLEGDREVYV